ncbi:MAG TPA: PEGA domain-containing protein [Polyangiaceae bacterium]|jgi:hypothetical protein|nr:PEGA domain-containing protein [Polyangiaceae bacterium]
MKRFFCAVPAVVAILVSVPARADAPTRAAENAERADKLFVEGTNAFEQRQYAEAYRSLRAAWDLAPSYRTAAELGQVELQIAAYRDAATHLAYCLRHLPADVEPTAREHIEQGLAEAREHTAALRIRVTVEDADVTVDGASVGRSPLEGVVFVEPGAHELAATRLGYVETSQTVQAPVRAALDVTLNLVPTSPSSPISALPLAPAPPAPAAPPEDATPHASSGLPPATWVLIIGGSLTAVALGTAIGFEVKGSSDNSDVQKLAAQVGASTSSCSSSTAPTCSQLVDKRSDRNSANEIATGMGITTGVLAAATAITAFVLWPHKRASGKDTALRIDAGGNATGGTVWIGGHF